MVIHNSNVVRVFTVPAEANAPLVVDADAVLSGAIAFQGFQAVAGRQGQVTQFARAIKLRELPQGHALNLRRQAVVTPPLPQPLCLPASEAGNHRVNLSFHDNMSSCSCACFRKQCVRPPPANRRGGRGRAAAAAIVAVVL
jgi:hypothetical protein